MRNAFPLFRRWLRRADVEASINLPRVGADNRGRLTLGEPVRDAALPRRGRTADDADLSAGRIDAQSRPRSIVRSSLDRARRAPAMSCREAQRTALASRTERVCRRL